MSKVRVFLQGNKEQEPKWFVLFAGEDYYPGGGASDFVAAYSSLKEAQAAISQLDEDHEDYRTGSDNYFIDGEVYDWCDIQDLREWVYGEEE